MSIVCLNYFHNHLRNSFLEVVKCVKQPNAFETFENNFYNANKMPNI